MGIVLNRGNVQRVLASCNLSITLELDSYISFLSRRRRNIFYFEEKYFVPRTHTYYIVGKNWQS